MIFFIFRMTSNTGNFIREFKEDFEGDFKGGYELNFEKDINVSKKSQT